MFLYHFYFIYYLLQYKPDLSHNQCYIIYNLVAYTTFFKFSKH